MKRFILGYWYVLPILLALSMISLIFLFLSYPSVIGDFFSLLLLLTLILLPVSWVVLFVNKQRRKCFLSFSFSFVIFGVLCLPLMMVSMRKEPVDSLDPNTYLTIWKDCQGGIYTYDFYYGPLPAGDIYLKCFEVTENLPLSEERIAAESSQAIINPTSSFSKLVSRHEFTIYEGDWGDYYAARIEVWHRDATTKKERKLMEKVYRVEGWMR